MNMKLSLDDNFKEFIRSSIPVSFNNYSSFAVLLKRVEGTPGFDIALDGTYSKSTDHVDSVICFCFTENTTLCVIEDNIRETVRTANAPDEKHDSNWDHKEKITHYHAFHSMLFNSNIFLKEGDNVLSSDNNYSLSVQVRSDSVLVDYKIANNCCRYTGYFNRKDI